MPNIVRKAYIKKAAFLSFFFVVTSAVFVSHGCSIMIFLSK